MSKENTTNLRVLLQKINASDKQKSELSKVLKQRVYEYNKDRGAKIKDCDIVNIQLSNFKDDGCNCISILYHSIFGNSYAVLKISAEALANDIKKYWYEIAHDFIDSAYLVYFRYNNKEYLVQADRRDKSAYDALLWLELQIEIWSE